jgi:hypothetical protein
MMESSMEADIFRAMEFVMKNKSKDSGEWKLVQACTSKFWRLKSFFDGPR